MSKEPIDYQKKWAELHAEGRFYKMAILLLALLWEKYLVPRGRWKWILASIVPIIIIMELSPFWGLLIAGFVLFFPL